MSRFYKRDQIHLRTAVFLTAASSTSAISGMLASAIVRVDGRSGHSGWQWISILEGIFTAAFGLLSFFLLPRTPTSSRFLGDTERQSIHAVSKQYWAPDSEEEPFSWGQVIVAFTTRHVGSMEAFTSAPAISTWNVNNVQPHYKRSTAITFGLATANFGGILSTWIFDDPPRLAQVTIINLACSLGICGLVVNRVWLVAPNKGKEGEWEGRQRFGSEAEEGAERRRLGDDHPDFIYTL